MLVSHVMTKHVIIASRAIRGSRGLSAVKDRSTNSVGGFILPWDFPYCVRAALLFVGWLCSEKCDRSGSLWLFQIVSYTLFLPSNLLPFCLSFPSGLSPHSTSISAPTVTQCHHRQRLGSCAFSKCRKIYPIAIIRDNVLDDLTYFYISYSLWWQPQEAEFLPSLLHSIYGHFLLVFLKHTVFPPECWKMMSQTQGISAENLIFRQVRVHHHSAYRRCNLDIICSLDSVCSFLSQHSTSSTHPGRERYHPKKEPLREENGSVSQMYSIPQEIFRSEIFQTYLRELWFFNQTTQPFLWKYYVHFSSTSFLCSVLSARTST